MALAQSI